MPQDNPNRDFPGNLSEELYTEASRRPSNGGQLNDIFSVPDVLNKLRGQEGEHLDPFRLRIQKALSVALRQIHPENGFLCDLTEAARVARGRRYLSADIPLPLVSILEEPFSFEEDLAPVTGQARSEPYELIFQGFVDDDSDNPTDPAHILLADVRQRLVLLKQDEDHPHWMFRMGSEPEPGLDQYKPNTVLGMVFDGGVVRPADEISATAYFWLRVSFDVSEDPRKPTR